MILRYTLLFALTLFVTNAAASTDGAWIIDVDEPVLWADAGDDEYSAKAESDYQRAIKAYEVARSQLDEEHWEDAADLFDEIVKMKSRYADASQYWKAYALYKAGRSSKALRALESFFEENYSDSRWHDDARMLEAEIRGGAGQSRSPDAHDDDELKLIVINGLMHTDSERAVPMLKKILDGNNSPELKERALFVLVQSGTPEARQIMADYARGSSDPELQMEAIQYLGIFGDGASGRLLKEIYGSTTDREVKEQILESFMLSDDSEYLLQVARAEKSARLRGKAIEILGLLDEGEALWEMYQIEKDLDVREKLIESFMLSDNTDRLLDIARNETDRELRAKAIEQLGLVGDEEDLWELYQTETDVEVRSTILDGLWLGDGTDLLIEVARTEKNAELRASAIEKLGLTGGRAARTELVSLYETETDREVKEEILDAMFLQHNVDGLIEIARMEKDRDLRREAVEKLSIMGDDRATDFLLELLDD